MQRLVQHVIFILLLYKWRISTASSSPLKIAKENCTSQCGGVSIPYPFGIGPNNHCYFNSWYEIECNLSVPVAKPFLRRLQLEVLNISVYGGNATVQVPSPVTCLSCKGKQSPPAPNLTRSPFMYSSENSFVAVSCDSFASLRTDPTHTLTGCSSTCLAEDILSASDMCEYGYNCCRTALSQYFTTFSVTQERDETRRNKTDGEDFAFLVDQQWFDEHKSDFRAIKRRGVVPVKLRWILSLEKNRSLIKSIEALNKVDGRRNPNDSTPTCYEYGFLRNYTWWSDLYDCTCPPGYEGNPYLLLPCGDIDECKDSNPCQGDDLNTTTTWNISNAKCQNTDGGHICYSNRTGETCELFASDRVAKCYHKSSPHSQLKPILSGN